MVEMLRSDAMHVQFTPLSPYELRLTKEQSYCHSTIILRYHTISTEVLIMLGRVIRVGHRVNCNILRYNQSIQTDLHHTKFRNTITT